MQAGPGGSVASELGERGCTAWRRRRLGELAHGVSHAGYQGVHLCQQENGKGPQVALCARLRNPSVRCWGREAPNCLRLLLLSVCFRLTGVPSFIRDGVWLKRGSQEVTVRQGTHLAFSFCSRLSRELFKNIFGPLGTLL